MDNLLISRESLKFAQPAAVIHMSFTGIFSFCIQLATVALLSIHFPMFKQYTGNKCFMVLEISCYTYVLEIQRLHRYSMHPCSVIEEKVERK